MSISNFSMIIDDGDMYATGLNTDGQLGLGHKDTVKIFTKVPFDFKWKKVSTGTAFSLAIDENDYLYATGLNTDGQLGLGDAISRTVFTKIGSKKWKDVFCGGVFSLAIDENDFLHSWGNNSAGQLGVANLTATGRAIPDKTDFVGKVKKIAAGSLYSVIIDENNFLYTCGHNGGGQLGTGDNTFSKIFLKVAENCSDINCASSTTYAVINDKLHSCGVNDTSQLGDNTTTNRNYFAQMSDVKVQKIFCGSYLLVIDESYEVWGVGSNSKGVFGQGNTTTIKKLTKLNFKAQDIFAGRTHAHYLIDNFYYTAGRNDEYQLGTGNQAPKNTLTPVTVFAKATRYLFSKSSTAYTIENNTLKSLGTITTANASTLFKSGIEAITKEHCVLVGQQLGKAKIMRMLV